jgi:hypothetical protein
MKKRTKANCNINNTFHFFPLCLFVLKWSGRGRMLVAVSFWILNNFYKMNKLRVEPSEIEFRSIEPGNLYVMTFSVRNISSTAQRIRLQAPKSSIFALNYIPSNAVAPGLDLRAEIECLIPIEADGHMFLDRIIASTGDERVEIPIRACKPSLNLICSQLLDFGAVTQSQQSVKELWFENVSNLSGTLKLFMQRPGCLKLSTSKLEIQPKGCEGSRVSVKVVIESNECGFYRDYLHYTDIASNEDRTVEVVAQVVQPALTIVTNDKNGLFELASFGDVFYGQKKSIMASLVNSGPQALSFSIRFEDDDEGTQSQEKYLSIFPMDGVVKPYSEIELACMFAPAFQEPEKGFQKSFKQTLQSGTMQRRVAVLECIESTQNISIGFEGNAVLPTISISPSILRFGDCPVNDRRDLLLTMKNTSKLPLSFNFPVIANFKFHPSQGKVLPEESISVIASFLPPQLGVFKTSARVAIENGLLVMDLKLLGEANNAGDKKVLVGGTDKLPQDFKTSYKFVDPEEVAVARAEKRFEKERKEASAVANALKEREVKQPDLSNDPPIINASAENDEIYGTNAVHRVERDPKEAYKQQMLNFYKQHNSQYNEYLQKSAIRREFEMSLRKKTKLLQSGAVDFSDPFGVNMGMDRGLEEPTLQIPIANDQLLLTKSGGGGSGTSGGKSRLPVDENRLIQKKYASEPTTQAQYKDCTSELNSDELKEVTSSHKVRLSF